MPRVPKGLFQLERHTVSSLERIAVLATKVQVPVDLGPFADPSGVGLLADSGIAESPRPSDAFSYSAFCGSDQSGHFSRFSVLLCRSPSCCRRRQSRARCCFSIIVFSIFFGVRLHLRCDRSYAPHEVDAHCSAGVLGDPQLPDAIHVRAGSEGVVEGDHNEHVIPWPLWIPACRRVFSGPRVHENLRPDSV